MCSRYTNPVFVHSCRIHWVVSLGAFVLVSSRCFAICRGTAVWGRRDALRSGEVLLCAETSLNWLRGLRGWRCVCAVWFPSKKVLDATVRPKSTCQVLTMFVSCFWSYWGRSRELLLIPRAGERGKCVTWVIMAQLPSPSLSCHHNIDLGPRDLSVSEDLYDPCYLSYFHICQVDVWIHCLLFEVALRTRVLWVIGCRAAFGICLLTEPFPVGTCCNQTRACLPNEIASPSLVGNRGCRWAEC